MSFLDKLILLLKTGVWGAPKWDKCTKSSNWDGNNAARRMMNSLSPYMSDDKFKEYLKWQKNRGCNFVNFFVTNKADGEYAAGTNGYSIYGGKFDFQIDKNVCKKMLNRIMAAREEGMAVVLWLASDDSTAWNHTMAKNAQAYIDDLHKQGFLDDDLVSIVVLGLEMSEYWSASEVANIYNALRKHWKGKIGTHDVSNKASYAVYGDILFWQTEPSTSDIAASTNKAKKFGKPVCFFELERFPDRAKCQVALSSGAFSVGNW